MADEAIIGRTVISLIRLSNKKEQITIALKSFNLGKLVLCEYL